MHFYTFVDITPQLFNDKLTSISGIDYVYTDNTGKVIKKTISGSGNEKIPDGISIVHLVLERDKQVYESNEQVYMDILTDKCSTIEYRNRLIKILGGEIIEMKSTGNFTDDEDEEDDQSVDSRVTEQSGDSRVTDYLYDANSPSSTPRTGNKERQPLFSNRQPGWEKSRRPLSATSAQSTPRLSSEEQARMLDPSKLPKKTTKNNPNSIAATDFANEYNRGKNPHARVEALKKVKKEHQTAVLNLFTDKEPSNGKGGLPERHVVESHFNHFNHLANEGSRPPSGSSQQTLIESGRRALVYNSGSYKIGIVGPINRSTEQYVIDVPSGTETSYKINNEDFEDKHHIPRNFVSTWYYLLTNSIEKPRNNIFLLKEKSLTQLRTKEHSGRTWGGGKKTKKVYPAKKNITRSKRR